MGDRRRDAAVRFAPLPVVRADAVHALMAFDPTPDGPERRARRDALEQRLHATLRRSYAARLSYNRMACTRSVGAKWAVWAHMHGCDDWGKVECATRAYAKLRRARGAQRGRVAVRRAFSTWRARSASSPC